MRQKIQKMCFDLQINEFGLVAINSHSNEEKTCHRQKMLTNSPNHSDITKKNIFQLYFSQTDGEI